MEYKHNPPSLVQMREHRSPLWKGTRKDAKVVLTPLEKFAVFVTKRVGSMGFFFLLLLVTLVWLLWNVLGPVEMRFDPAPAFVIWLFGSNVLQLILLPLIMVGQNLEGKYSDLRAQADFEVNKKSEHEIEVIVAHLENQNELLLELMRKVERS